MRIIHSVEINYFRSCHSVSLSRLKDMNVILGENDVGKSNVLKSLNLFFNNDVELDEEFDFDRDLSRKREYEVKSTKGRASVWIKITFNNFLNWSSLPKRFYVKRSWNRYSNFPIESHTAEINPINVAKFLNKIKFHYVPAVRGREIFSFYLQELHDSLVEDEKAGVLDASRSLLDKINENTQDMSKKNKNGAWI